MISSISSSLSALASFGTKMGVTANNIANADSEEFKKSRVTLTEGPTSTVKADISRIDSPGNIVYEKDQAGQLVEKELSNVDLTGEIPQTIIAQRGYEANLKVIQAHDDILGAIIDTLG